MDLTQPAPGTGGIPAHIVGDLHQIRGQRLQRPVGKRQRILTGQGVEFIFIRDEFRPRQLREIPADLHVELLGRVQAGAHGGAADGQTPKLFQG
ncbi:hypothetical protein SDC9_120731 [bioreactor metagenome]|uniref:Uncharacterized protein n=1 Tax=bioreactor metagenome TaxID=1076179 RepID=A0A645C9Z2_9ZZZZ